MGKHDRPDPLEGHALETYRSLISIGVESTKAMLLLNGGAIVAVLAYVGQAGQNSQRLAALVTLPMLLFVVGLALAALSFLSAYQTQLSLFNERHHEGERHVVWQRFTIVLLILSLVAFGTGAGCSVRAMAFTAPHGV